MTRVSLLKMFIQSRLESNTYFPPKCCFYIKGNIGKCFCQILIWTICVCNARVLFRNSAYIPDNHDVPNAGNGGRPISGAGRFPR